jgi:aerobic carbon-monoxide dehydrogenase medium subunit
MSFDYHEPTSIREAVELGARFGEEGRFLGGGTDLMIQIHRGRCAPRQVVGLHRVPGLDAIDVDGTIALGALVTHRRLERVPAFQGALRALVESAEVIGGHQIRNVATVGGNVVNASPAADGVPVLLALDATVTCLGPDGERTMPLHGFASGPGVTARRPDELLTRVAFPRLPPRLATAFLKAGRRRAMEISLVCVAARVTLDPSFERCEDVRIALGAVAPPRSARGGRSAASKAARSPRRRCERRDGSPRPSAGRSATCAPRHATARCS